jgi:hypothetical protein
MGSCFLRQRKKAVDCLAGKGLKVFVFLEVRANSESIDMYWFKGFKKSEECFFPDCDRLIEDIRANLF